MSRDYKNTRGRRAGSGLSGSAGFLVGLAVGLGIAAAIYIYDRRPTAPPAGEENPGGTTGEDPFDARATAWAAVDLAAVRKAMPDNIYWTMSAPTTDPEVLRAREEERARWNVEYGKILSNTATPEEIDAYYAQRQRLSHDYIEFATHLMVNYGKQLPRQDMGLLKLAIEMHMARLEEIPRQIAEAHARCAAHDAARRAWLEEQKAFEDAPPDPP